MSVLRSFVLAVAVTAATAVSALAQGVPSPDQFFGFPMGTEKKLAAWDQIVGYFNEVDRASDRVLVQELGKTTMGRPYIMAIVSSPDTLKDLAKYQEAQRKLADPRRTPAEEAGRIAREGKAVLLIGMNVHSTEIGNSQMVNKLLYRLATEDSPWVEQVLRNVILLLIPSENPDGQQMVVDWYNKTVGTPFENAPLPELYQKYAGHDDNRDAYMLALVETRYLTRVLYRDWLPEVYLDKHQMGSARARIFVPPFKNPPNPNVDPIVWSEVNLLGQAMAARLAEAGKTGVIWGEQYTGFWQGANNNGPWWHNMIGLLTETASSRLGGTLDQERARPARPASDTPRVAAGERDPDAPLPAPTDTQYRMNYLQPWLGGPWSLADVVDYQYTSALGLIEAVANNKEMLKRNFYLMNQRTIERFKQGSPFAWIVPAGQRDPVATARLLQLIQAQGGEVQRSARDFTADGRTYRAGAYVVALAQPAGRWIKDLLEPQTYPDIRWPVPTMPVDRPYDVAAWSLGMLMGVETILADKPFDAELVRVTGDVEAPAGTVHGTGPVHVFGHESVASVTATNRLLADGAQVSWARDQVEVNGRTFSPGAVVVRGAKAALIEKIARDLALDVEATAQSPAGVGLLELKAPRVAIYEPWGGNMDAGWTRLIFEQHELPFTQARPADLKKPGLLDRFDVIVFAEMSPSQIMRGSQARNVPPEYRGGIGDEGLRNLRQFIEDGGAIVTLGNAAQFAIEQLGAPVENVLKDLDQDAFFCPGSILRLEVDTRHPIGYGMASTADAMFMNNGGYLPAAALSSTRTATIARYPQASLLRSGWIMGESHLQGTGAVLETSIGKGRIIMHTFRVQIRAQSWNTYHLLFNSIYYGAAPASRAALAPARPPGTAAGR